MVKHPLCVRYKFHGKNGVMARENGICFICMEYVPGGTLGDLLSYYNLGHHGARFFLEQLCEVIGFLHQQSIIHGDLKPANILLDLHFNIKLGDFGLIRSSHADSISWTGTTAYMAPEVELNYNNRSKNPKKVNGLKNDIFSLGVTIYEITFGIKPFESTINDSNYELIK